MKTRHVAALGTAVVIVYVVTIFTHGAAHARLAIRISNAQNSFVWAVMLISPLLAMILLWTSMQRMGLYLLALSMAAAIPFDLYFHFIAPGPDNALQQRTSGLWPATFVITAYLLLLFAVVGVLVGVWFLRGSHRKA